MACYALAACSNAAELPAKNEIAKASKPSASQLECTAEQLSCGKQLPTVTDGRRLINDEMGLSVVFASGSYVCIARSGDAPRGFYGWTGHSSKCEERDEKRSGLMVLYGSWNALFWTSPERSVWDDCKPLSSAIKQVLRRPLSFAGHDSVACQSEGSEGRIDVTVFALAGTGCDRNIPAVSYHASLVTRPDRLTDDLAAFERFLDGARIGLVQANCR